MQPEALARCILAGTPGPDPRALPAASQHLRAAAGACVAARRQPHVQAALLAIDQPGPCTVFGHPQTLGVEGAVFVGGIAAQDDEGHAVVLAMLAAAQRHGAGGDDLLRGIAVGLELNGRLRQQPARAVLATAAGVGALLELTEGQLASAIGLAAGMASPPHAAGPDMPQLHAGWAAQAGYRAVRLAMSAFGGFGGYVAAPALFDGLDQPLIGLGETWLWLDVQRARPSFDFQALCAQGELPAARAQALEAALDGLFRRPFIDTDALAF
jgi:2-methylcitrate dehydratase PrpD